MPRVLFIAPSAYPLGGVQTWLDDVAAGLPAHGWDVTVGLASGRWHDVDTYREAHPGLRCIPLDNPTGSREGRVRAIAAALRAQGPDLVVGVNMPDTYTAAARVRAAGATLRSVMSLHGVQPNLYDDVTQYGPLLDGLVCTNRLAVALAVEHGMPAQRVHYAPYGVALPEPVVRDGRSGPLKIAYVGRLEQWQKRVFDIPAILDQLHASGIPFELRIAGAGPQQGDLRDRLAAHESAGRVQWLGALSAAQLAQRVYRVCDVLLLTSSWETGPIVAWEAMAHGVALVAARYVGCGLEGALRDQVNCLLFPVGDTAAAARQLARAADASLRVQIATRGRQLVHERYGVEASVRAWAGVFDRILAMPPVVGGEAPAPPGGAHGRLDAWLGPRFAQTVRSLAGRRFEHTSGGGEWPHSYGTRDLEDGAFWSEAARLEQEARP